MGCCSGNRAYCGRHGAETLDGHPHLPYQKRTVADLWADIKPYRDRFHAASVVGSSDRELIFEEYVRARAPLDAVVEAEFHAWMARSEGSANPTEGFILHLGGGVGAMWDGESTCFVDCAEARDIFLDERRST
jgi:hypothetical protein